MNYLSSAKGVFTSYKTLAEKAMAQMQDADLFWQPDADSNSVATIVKHLWGNMLSRWTNFLTEDGEKSWRQRDSEFENDINTREELMRKWNAGWQCLFDALNSLTNADLEKAVYIRSEQHTALEATNRQIAHYASHVGQIIYIAKMCAKENFKSLSIPKGKSAEFNKELFSKGKK